MKPLQKYKNDVRSMVKDVHQNYGVKVSQGGIQSMKAGKEMMNSAEFNEELKKDEEIDEITGAGSSGAFVSPMGWNNDTGMSKLKNEEELDEMTGSASSGAYSQPAIWAKNRKNWRAVSDPNFPKYGGPGAKYVRVKEKNVESSHTVIREI